MKTTDISPLIKLALTIISISLAVGQFDRLRTFAAKEFIRSSKGWHSEPFFGSPNRATMIPAPAKPNSASNRKCQ